MRTICLLMLLYLAAQLSRLFRRWLLPSTFMLVLSSSGDSRWLVLRFFEGGLSFELVVLNSDFGAYIIVRICFIHMVNFYYKVSCLIIINFKFYKLTQLLHFDFTK
jgi:hypothetical protein